MIYIYIYYTETEIDSKISNNDLDRDYILNIAGYGVLEWSGNVVILQYTNTSFDPSDNYVPEGYRPLAAGGIWGVWLHLQAILQMNIEYKFKKQDKLLFRKTERVYLLPLISVARLCG